MPESRLKQRMAAKKAKTQAKKEERRQADNVELGLTWDELVKAVGMLNQGILAQTQIISTPFTLVEKQAFTQSEVEELADLAAKYGKEMEEIREPLKAISDAVPKELGVEITEDEIDALGAPEDADGHVTMLGIYSRIAEIDEHHQMAIMPIVERFAQIRAAVNARIQEGDKDERR